MRRSNPRPAVVTAQTLRACRLPLAETVTICERIALYLESGISIVAALDLVALDASRRSTSLFLTEVTAQVRSGHSVSYAYSLFPRVFPRTAIGILQGAEATGRLAAGLRTVATRLRGRLNLYRSMLSAALYPAIVFASAVGVGAFLLLTALPALIPILTSMHVALPLPTRILLSVNATIRSWGGVIALLFVLTSAGTTLMFSWLPRAKQWIRGLFLRLPGIGVIPRDIESGQLLETLADLLDSGVRIDAALDLVAAAATYSAFQDACGRARQAVYQGSSLNEALRNSGAELSASALALIATGERSGSLAHCLRLAGREAAERGALRLTLVGKLAEPLLLLLLAGLVGLFAAAVLLPLYSLTRAMPTL